MGSFYSTCSITNMTLSRQKTSVILLSPTLNDFYEEKSMIVESALYNPFGFPIKGEYDDYGYLHHIKEDVNTKMLEEFFGISIYNIIKGIGRMDDVSEKLKNRDIFSKLAMTYIRTEVLEYMEGNMGYGISSESRKTAEDIVDILESAKGHNIADSYRISNALTRLTYIERYNDIDMFSLLPIDSKFTDLILNQFMFMRSLKEMRKILTPSTYGSQYTNWVSIFKMNELTNELLISDIRKDVDEYGDDDPSWMVEEKQLLKKYDRNKKIEDTLNLN